MPLKRWVAVGLVDRAQDVRRSEGADECRGAVPPVFHHCGQHAFRIAGVGDPNPTTAMVMRVDEPGQHITPRGGLQHLGFRARGACFSDLVDRPTSTILSPPMRTAPSSRMSDGVTTRARIRVWLEGTFLT